MGHQHIKGPLCPVWGAPYIKEQAHNSRAEGMGTDGAMERDLNWLDPLGRSCSHGVALEEQRGGSSPPAKVPLCCARWRLRVGIALWLPAGLKWAQSCLWPFYYRQALQRRQDFVI